MRIRSIPAIMVISVLAACGRNDPRLEPITSSTSGAYDRWRMMAGDSIRPEEWREFDAMLQELRLCIMANREATGHDGIEAALRSKIHGANFRGVIVMGYQAKLVRLAAEREEVRRVMNGNNWKSVWLKDAEFERARAQQEKRLLAIDEEVYVTKRRLADFGHY